jgi:hypothetical protein
MAIKRPKPEEIAALGHDVINRARLCEARCHMPEE